MKPLIGITCATSYFDKNAPNPQDRMNMAYTRAVEEAGGIPVIIPSIATEDYMDELLERLDGVVLSGGADVDPQVFGEQIVNETVEVDPWRDGSELKFIEKVLSTELPVLCICRGIQSLNVVMGGTLYQDLPSQNPTPIKHQQSESRTFETHSVEFVEGSKIAEIIGSNSMEVNSFHHQALKDVAGGLRVTGQAPDGIIEAIEGTGERWLIGVQFHPEELVKGNQGARKLFKAFTTQCAIQN